MRERHINKQKVSERERKRERKSLVTTHHLFAHNDERCIPTNRE